MGEFGWPPGMFPEQLQRPVFRRGREREVAGVRQHLARLNQFVDGVLNRFLVFLIVTRSA